MSNFTSLGAELWSWRPWLDLPDDTARMFWLALYTTPEAKRVVPGLWHGSILTMAEAAHMPVDRAGDALDKLLTTDMAEFDPANRVLRLTKLPDSGECPKNDSWVRGWWNRFKSVPTCAVRDAHVKTLWWIIEERSRSTMKPINQALIKAWGETFASVPIPAPRKRGVRRLADDDLSTPVQPSLFASAPSAPKPERHDARHDATPCHEAGSVDNIGGQGFRPPNIMRASTGSGPGSGDLISSPDRQDHPVASGALSDLPGDHVRSGGPPRQSPHLELVPHFTPATLVRELAIASDAWSQSIAPTCAQACLSATIRELDAHGVGPPEIALAGKWLARQTRSLQSRYPNVPPAELLATWASVPNAVLYAVRCAQDDESATTDRMAAWRAATEGVPR